MVEDGGDEDEHLVKLDQRYRLLSASQAIDQQTSSIKRSQMTLQSVDDMANGVLGQLQSQRGQLENARDGLRDTDESLGRAARIIKSMNNRAMTNKLVMAFVIAAVLLAIILILYFKYFKPVIEAGAASSASSSSSSSSKP